MLRKLIFIFLLLHGSLVKANVEPYPVWVSPDLGVNSLSSQDIDAALNRKFWDNPNYFRDFPKEISYLKENQNKEGMPVSCAAIDKLMRKGVMQDDGDVSFKNESDKRNKLLGTFLNYSQTECQAIRLLKTAKPAQNSAVRNFGFESNFENYLPQVVMPRDSACILNDSLDSIPDHQKMSWSEYFKNREARYKENTSFEILKKTSSSIDLILKSNDIQKKSGDEYFSKMKILAMGDFNNSHWEQLLVLVQSGLIVSNGKNISNASQNFYTSLYLLMRKVPGAVLEAFDSDNYLVLMMGSYNDQDYSYSCNSRLY